MYYKCELIFNGMSYDATDDLNNWDEIAVAYKRSGMDGVVRSFASQYTFSGDTYARLKEAFLATGLRNDIFVNLYTQNNSWTWNKVCGFRADNSTIEFTGNQVSFKCIDDSIASKLKAQARTKFEYLVSGMEREDLTFGRIRMNNWEKFTLAIESNDENGKFMSGNYVYTDGQNGRYKLPLYYTENSIPVPGAVELYDQEPVKIGNVADQGFLVCKKDINVHVRLKLRIAGGWLGSSEYRPQMYLQKWSSQYSTYSTIQASNDYFDGIMTTQMTLDVDRDISLVAGDTLLVTVQVPVISESSLENGRALFTVHGFRDDETNATLEVSWQDIGNPVDFSVSRPQEVLSKLVASICGSEITGEIIDAGNARLRDCRLAAAESIRKYPGAKMYVSWDGFCKFMEAVFGYVYKIDQDAGKITFLHRDELFGDSVVKELTEATGYRLNVDSGLLYSAVEVGNEAVDYDEENGKYEYNFRQSYTTGSDLTQNVLTLTPGFRLDSMGVEYLTETIGQDTKDDKSDNDIFAIHTDGAGRPYTGVSVSGPGADMGLFNAMYHARYCIEANKKYIGTFASLLRYASSDGNSGYTIGGQDTQADIALSEFMYTPFSLSVDTGDTDFPTEFNGLVRVEHGGHTHTGWISKIELRYTKLQKATYTLMLDAETIGN